MLYKHNAPVNVTIMAMSKNKSTVFIILTNSNLSYIEAYNYPPHHTTNHNHLRLFFRNHPGELVPEENFWTLYYGARED